MFKLLVLIVMVMGAHNALGMAALKAKQGQLAAEELKWAKVAQEMQKFVKEKFEILEKNYKIFLGQSGQYKGVSSNEDLKKRLTQQFGITFSEKEEEEATKADDLFSDTFVTVYRDVFNQGGRYQNIFTQAKQHNSNKENAWNEAYKAVMDFAQNTIAPKILQLRESKLTNDIKEGLKDHLDDMLGAAVDIAWEYGDKYYEGKPLPENENFSRLQNLEYLSEIFIENINTKNMTREDINELVGNMKGIPIDDTISEESEGEWEEED